MIFTDPTYLRTIYDGFLSGTLHKDNASSLPVGLVGIYEEALPPANQVKDRQKFLEFFSAWALLKKEVSIEFVASLLRWPEEQVLDYLARHSKWFNAPTSGKYVLYHERLRSFVLQKISYAHFSSCNEAIIKMGQEALEKRSGDEWEYYALEYLSAHLLIRAMEKGNADALKALSYNTAHWNRQVDISKGFEWSKRMLNDMMLWASKYDDEEVIDCMLNKVTLYHQEQNDAPRIVELVAQNDMDTALKRIEAFGGNDQEGLQRKFILYMLCLMELTLLDSKDKPFRKDAIEKLLKHMGQYLPSDRSITNFISKELISAMAIQWDMMELTLPVYIDLVDYWDDYFNFIFSNEMYFPESKYTNRIIELKNTLKDEKAIAIAEFEISCKLYELNRIKESGVYLKSFIAIISKLEKGDVVAKTMLDIFRTIIDKNLKNDYNKVIDKFEKIIKYKCQLIEKNAVEFLLVYADFLRKIGFNDKFESAIHDIQFEIQKLYGIDRERKLFELANKLIGWKGLDEAVVFLSHESDVKGNINDKYRLGKFYAEAGCFDEARLAFFSFKKVRQDSWHLIGTWYVQLWEHLIPVLLYDDTDTSFSAVDHFIKSHFVDHYDAEEFFQYLFNVFPVDKYERILGCFELCFNSNIKDGYIVRCLSELRNKELYDSALSLISFIKNPIVKNKELENVATCLLKKKSNLGFNLYVNRISNFNYEFESVMLQQENVVSQLLVEGAKNNSLSFVMAGSGFISDQYKRESILVECCEILARAGTVEDLDFVLQKINMQYCKALANIKIANQYFLTHNNIQKFEEHLKRARFLANDIRYDEGSITQDIAATYVKLGKMDDAYSYLYDEVLNYKMDDISPDDDYTLPHKNVEIYLDCFLEVLPLVPVYVCLKDVLECIDELIYYGSGNYYYPMEYFYGKVAEVIEYYVKLNQIKNANTIIRKVNSISFEVDMLLCMANYYRGKKNNLKECSILIQIKNIILNFNNETNIYNQFIKIYAYYRSNNRHEEAENIFLEVIKKIEDYNLFIKFIMNKYNISDNQKNISFIKTKINSLWIDKNYHLIDSKIKNNIYKLECYEPSDFKPLRNFNKNSKKIETKSITDNVNINKFNDLDLFYSSKEDTLLSHLNTLQVKLINDENLLYIIKKWHGKVLKTSCLMLVYFLKSISLNKYDSVKYEHVTKLYGLDSFLN